MLKDVRKNLPALIILGILMALLVAFSFFVPLREQKTVPVIMYHSINIRPIGIKDVTVGADAFDSQMKYLADNGYTSLTLDEDFTKYEKPIYITFDDGYVDNYKFAYPILEKYNMVATIFLIAKNINMPGYLSQEQILSMENRVSFQSHTVNHRRLSWMSRKEVDYECSISKDIISSVTKKAVFAISYPDGAYNAVVSGIASKYYSCALTTLNGFESQLQGNFKIRRITISPANTMDDFITMLHSEGKI